MLDLPDVPVLVEEGGVAAQQAASVPLLPGAAVVHQQNIPAQHYKLQQVRGCLVCFIKVKRCIKNSIIK